MQRSKCERACRASPGICSWEGTWKKAQVQATSWRTSKFIGVCKPQPQVVSSMGWRQKAKPQVGAEPGAQPRHPRPQACTLLRTHLKQLPSLVPSASMFLTSQEKHSTIFQKRRKCRAVTPNFSHLHPAPVLDPQIPGEKIASALSKVLHYKTYREMLALK